MAARRGPGAGGERAGGWEDDDSRDGQGPLFEPSDVAPPLPAAPIGGPAAGADRGEPGPIFHTVDDDEDDPRTLHDFPTLLPGPAPAPAPTPSGRQAQAARPGPGSGGAPPGARGEGAVVDVSDLGLPARPAAGGSTGRGARAESRPAPTPLVVPLGESDERPAPVGWAGPRPARPSEVREDGRDPAEVSTLGHGEEEDEAPSAAEFDPLERTEREAIDPFDPVVTSEADLAPYGLSSRSAADLEPGSSGDARDPFESSRVARGGARAGPGRALRRRTDEVHVPSLEETAARSHLFEDSDVTPLPLLGGAGDGPLTGLLEAREDAQGRLVVDDRPSGASLRVVRVSVERIVGLWEGDALWLLLSFGLGLIGPALLLTGWSYYGLPREARPGHPLDELLRPGGSVGLALGISAALLFLLNLTYVLRRRLQLMKGLVSLRSWLNAHFLCGITGGSLVLAHSAMLARNDIARLCAAAIGAAIASGIFGRYVLSHLPRRRDGGAVGGDERQGMAARLVELRRRLRARLEERPALREALLEALADDAASQEGPVREGLALVGPLIVSDVVGAVRWRGLRRRIEGLAAGDPEARQLVQEVLALARVQRLEGRLARSEAVQDLLDSWRFVHLILALVVIATMALHVVIALQYGRFSVLGR